MLADLTRLSGSMRTTLPESLATLSVTGTWVGGQQVYG
jgi:predicted amidohydrolase YtcJ